MFEFGWRCLSVAVLMALVGLSASAQELPDASSVLPAAERDPDPWIRMNRGLWSFNDSLDRWVLRPIARGYTTITPDLIEEGVSNFFDNLQVPGVSINQFLQAKPRSGFSDAGRFLINSTVGVLGVFDVATRMGWLSTRKISGRH